MTSEFEGANMEVRPVGSSTQLLTETVNSRPKLGLA